MKYNVPTLYKRRSVSCTCMSLHRSRFLRETDRRKNGMNFPKLYYPELYLMEGGYRAFFKDHQVSLSYKMPEYHTNDINVTL